MSADERSHVAVHDFRLGRSWSRYGFEQLVGSAAAMLSRRLTEPRDQRVAVLSRNGVEMLALMLGCFRVGAVFVPLNWRLAREELSVLLADSQASLLFVQEEFRPLVQGATIPIPSLQLDFGPESLPAPAEPLPDGQLAVLLYTSGTSGRAKGVMLTLGNVRANSGNFRQVAKVEPQSGLLCDAPMFHTIGLLAICHTAVAVGARLYLSPAFVATDTVDRIGDAHHGITHYFTVPQVTQLLLQAPNFAPRKFSGLCALFVGGAPLSASLIETWRSHGVKLINGYGSSEAGTCIHMRLDDPVGLVAKPGSIGKAVPDICVSLHDRDGKAVAAGEVGEIWLKGPSVTSGYWRREEENRISFSDGWLRTGDAAICDPDGYYFIVDRWKDMYISGGENVYPAEVESVLSRLHGVAEAAVVGQPDPQWGEVGEAFVVLAPGANVTADDVVRHARGCLAAYKVPKRVTFMDHLPRTGSGKVRKTELRRAGSGQ